MVSVVETDKPKSCLYYLTEYIDGITLQQWIKENPRPVIQDVNNIFEQIVKGVRAFHRKDMLHQDIKPGNILIDKNGEVKIIDFGSCHVSGIAEIVSPIEHSSILGTRFFQYLV